MITFIAVSNCAYCGQDGTPTREEVLPLFLSRNRPFYRTVFDHERQIVRQGVITPVKDVCENCNNVTLSGLDQYAATLDRDYFLKPVGFLPNVEFRYDFHRLLRWLLKLIYNDDRTRAAPYETQEVVGYILGREPQPPRPISLFLGIIIPSRIIEGTPEILQPEGCGLGYTYFEGTITSDIAFSRFVQLNSYLFDVIAWKSSVSRAARHRNVELLCWREFLYELRPRQEKITVVAASLDYATLQEKHRMARLRYRAYLIR